VPTPADQPPAQPRASVREARLRPEHAATYPGVPAGEWLPAAALARQILTGLVSREGQPPQINARLMNDRHFEFRGGESSPRPRRNSRAVDGVTGPA
jgi:hypothetical protein